MASQMLAAGIPLVAVSQRLSHARASTTLNVYAHSVPGADREAAETLAAIIAAGREPGRGRNLRRNRTTLRAEGFMVRMRSTVEVEPTSEDFSEFFERTYTRLASACLLLTGSPAEAEDLAQEALSRICARWEVVRSMNSPCST